MSYEISRIPAAGRKRSAAARGLAPDLRYPAGNRRGLRATAAPENRSEDGAAAPVSAGAGR